MFNLFRKYETNKQLKKRLLKLCQEGDYGICQPPMVADIAINELRDFFLRKDWYISLPISHDQAIAQKLYTKLKENSRN